MAVIIQCSFCTIPMARGKSRSDSLTHVLENVRELAAKGIQEIVLTGVNLGDFGDADPGTNGTHFGNGDPEYKRRTREFFCTHPGTRSGKGNAPFPHFFHRTQPAQ